MYFAHEIFLHVWEQSWQTQQTNLPFDEVFLLFQLQKLQADLVFRNRVAITKTCFPIIKKRFVSDWTPRNDVEDTLLLICLISIDENPLNFSQMRRPNFHIWRKTFCFSIFWYCFAPISLKHSRILLWNQYRLFSCHNQDHLELIYTN